MTLENQLGDHWAARIGYVGNAARHFNISHDINAPSFVPGAATTAAGVNARRPYQPTPASFMYGAINLQDSSNNYSYNALQATLRGNMGRQLDLFAYYVWSKATSYEPSSAAPSVPVNGADISTDRGLSPTDIRNSFAMSILYRLPDVKRWGLFGKEALSGWQINSITQIQSGSSFTVISGSDTNLDNVLNDRADIVGPVYTGAKTRAQKIAGYLNPTGFAIPNGPYGNEQNDSIIGPGNVNTNLSVFKMFPIHEPLQLQFRAEAFNAFNNVNLGNPVANLKTLQAKLPTGQITSAGSPRILQFALKLVF